MKYLITLLTLSLLLLGCTSEAITPERVAVETSNPLQPTGEIYQIAIKNLGFEPTNLEIQAGDTVEWVNLENPLVDHVLIFEQKLPDLYLPAGGVVTHTFMESGNYLYSSVYNIDTTARVSDDKDRILHGVIIVN
jgi:plastocyanin